MLSQLTVPDYAAQVKREIVIGIEAMSWNCSQHIPLKYSEAEVKAQIEPLTAKIKELEAELDKLK